jgi:hypothetical protein
MTETDVLLFVALALAALLCDAARPAQRKRGWNNSRAATQKDVADVLLGNRSQPGPDTTGLIMFLVFVFGIAALAL